MTASDFAVLFAGYVGTLFVELPRLRARLFPSALACGATALAMTASGYVPIHSGSGFDRNTGKAFPRDAPPEEQMLYEMENLYRTLMGGFTTVQSLGSGRRDPLAKAWIEEGRLPGPRLLTSLRSVDEKTGTPDEIRQFIRQVVADGADVIKVLATASIRDGGAPTMTYEQVAPACDEARKLGRQALG